MISIIVARDQDGGIGLNNSIPWMGQYPEDMKFFSSKTTNQVVVMGNNTWLSLPSTVRPLPNRINCVVTSTFNADYHKGANTLILPHASASVATRIEALDIAHEDKDIFIIGGRQLWDDTLHIVDRIYITMIPGEYNCDTQFSFDLASTDFERVEILPLKQGDAPLEVWVYDRVVV